MVELYILFYEQAVGGMRKNWKKPICQVWAIALQFLGRVKTKEEMEIKVKENMGLMWYPTKPQLDMQVIQGRYWFIVSQHWHSI